MYFANPWGLLAFLAVPAIIVLHMYRRRFPSLVVAGLHLWAPESQINLPGRKLERLPATLSLLLEILAATLLALVLSRPMLDTEDRAVHLVAVLDNSASMQAKPADEASFREQAIAELKRRMARLPGGSVITLILSGKRPTMLVGPAVLWDEAAVQLETWRPTAPRHAFESAWDLGLQLIEESGELLFLTDKMPAAREIPRQMEVVSFGRRLENVAIDSATWNFNSTTGKGEVALRVRNLGREASPIVVLASRQDQTFFRRSTSLAAQAITSFDFEVPGGLGNMNVTVQAADDGLELDNRIVLLEPKVRTVHIANALDAEHGRHLVERVLRVIPNVELGTATDVDLLISPAGKTPEPTPHQWWLGMGPISVEESVRKQSQDVAGPYLLEKRNPLLEGVVLGGVIWGGIQPLKQPSLPLISAGRQSLLVQLSAIRSPAYLMNIDLQRSNLQESPDWPILLTNLVELRRNDLPGLQRWNYRLGEEIHFRLHETDADVVAAEGESLKLVHDERSRPLVRSRFVDIPGLEAPGLYTVHSGGEVFDRFAVNFLDVEESDLRNLAPGRHPAESNQNELLMEWNNPYTWGILICLLLILLTALADWFVLSRESSTFHR